MNIIENIKKYINYYDESKDKSKLIDLLKVVGRKIGSQIVLYVVIMHILISDSKTPVKVKATMIAALGYLILPADLVSDVLPVIGFTDDIAFLSYVITSTSEYITPEVRNLAKMKMAVWLNNKEKDANPINYN